MTPATLPESAQAGTSEASELRRILALDPVLILLTRDKVAIVDYEDYVRLELWRHSYQAVPNGDRWYARRCWKEDGHVRQTYLHNDIMGCKGVDHIDGNGLDNRQINIRRCTQSQNTANIRKVTGKSRYKGVVRNTPAKNTWKATIRIRGKKTHLGSFKDEIEAAKAYDNAARIEYGEFAVLNFPDA